MVTRKLGRKTKRQRAARGVVAGVEAAVDQEAARRAIDRRDYQMRDDYPSTRVRLWAEIYVVAISEACTRAEACRQADDAVFDLDEWALKRRPEMGKHWEHA